MNSRQPQATEVQNSSWTTTFHNVHLRKLQH